MGTITEIIDFMCLRETTRELRSTGKVEFDHGKPKRKLCEQSFYRTGSLINRLPSDLDIRQGQGHFITSHLGDKIFCPFRRQ